MMGAAGITNVGPINTPTTNAGAIAGFDPIMKLSKRANKKRKKMESAARQFVKRRNDPTYIDGRSKTARNLIKRLAKRKKKMSEETILEAPNASGGDTTKQAYKFIAQKRKVAKQQERQKRAQDRKKEIQLISRAKSTDYQKKAKERTKKLSQQLQGGASDNQKESFEGLIYLESLVEQINNENTNPVTYFFNDDTEVEITVEMAEAFLAKFGELSEDNMEKMMDMIPDSSDVMGLFMQM
mgnify:FL=1|tara:strand:- start:1107 stop:1826 length:720 start_codon:yes stop_codon:yes gene_type:complete